jgi:hypothetical protein
MILREHTPLLAPRDDLILRDGNTDDSNQYEQHMPSALEKAYNNSNKRDTT